MAGRFGIFFVCSLFLLFLMLPSHSQVELSLEEIVEKSIQAAGGKQNLAQIKNYSFRHGTTTFFMSSDGVMKMTEGKDPIITEVIIADSQKVRRNCFNRMTELKGVQKAMHQSLALLRSGLFTLVNFKDQLKFQGLKKYGPKKHYLLTAKVDDLDVEFYLDADDFLLRRAVFKGLDPNEGKYEVNHDYGPYQEIDGVKIPASWFISQVGTRGSTYEISEPTINQPLTKEFFSNLDVNVGEIEIEEAALKGNIVASGFQRNRLQIETNWTDECFQRAGFNARDKLIVEIADMEFEIDFLDSQPPREAIVPGAKFLFPNFRSENYVILLGPEEYNKLREKLEPLLPIRARKK